MKRKTSISAIIAFIITVICCIAMPTAAYALTAEEVNAAAGKNNYYINPANPDEHWLRSDGVWYKCDVVDSSNNLSKVTARVRSSMINRDESICVYIAVSDSKFTGKNVTGNAANQLSKNIVSAVCDNVYSIDSITDNTQRAKSGDYLKMMSQIVTKNCTRFPSASDQGKFNYYVLDFKFKNSSTANQEKAVDSFAKTWQSKFITNNPVIKGASNKNEKEYYIAKTIYNFAVLNSRYDYDVYNKKVDPSTQQYKNSHCAYGAIYGNTKDANGYLDYTKYNWATAADSQGLTKIKYGNQGLSVCDGYSMLIYYLCQLNGIDCKIVNGDYTEQSVHKSDPHAWNVVKLQDSDDNGKKWYFMDATFAENSSSTLKLNEITLIDYAYFLRGGQNAKFSVTQHQQLTDSVSGLSSADYTLKKSSINLSKTWVIMSRHKKDAAYNEVENYFVISPDKRYYKIDPNTYTLYECDKTMVYNGTEYYYCLNIQDCVNGIEYYCDEMLLKNAGNYSLTAYSINKSTVLYSLPFIISPLDMSQWNGYSKLIWNGDDIKGTSQQATNIEFTASQLTFNVQVYDVANQLLAQNTNYITYFVNQSNQLIDSPIQLGSYYIVIDFDSNQNDNYSNVLKIPFNIVKGNLGNFTISPLDNITFGEDILSSCGSLSSNGIVFYNGVDYTVSLENPSAINYGQDGYIIYTALPTSSYFNAGTQLKRYYKISSQFDLSSYLSGSALSKSAYPFTGSEIKPSGFTLTMKINGVDYALQENIDYIIVSYSNNINPGTAYVNVQFIGNFCGNAQLYFTISTQTGVINGAGNGTLSIDVKIADEMTYNGKKQTPNTRVKVNGVVLKEGKDYTVSGVDYHPGVYECTVKGQGAYSYVSYKKAVFVNPGNITDMSAFAYDEKITLKWAPQGGRCYYQVYSNDSKTKKWKLIATTDKSTITTNFAYVNGKKVPLKANKSYKFRVRAFIKATVNGKTYAKYSPYKTISVKASAKPLKATVKKPSIKKITSKKKKFTVKWAKAKGADGYEIQYATDKKIKKNKKTIKVSKGSATSATAQKLKSKKTYYVRIRAYQTINGKKLYSGYSKAVKVKVG